jgi:hypothetical protein
MWTPPRGGSGNELCSAKSIVHINTFKVHNRNVKLSVCDTTQPSLRRIGE